MADFNALLGAFHEATGNYEIGFYLAGAMVFTSGMLVFFLRHCGIKEKVTPNTYTESTNKMLYSTLIIQSMILVPPSRCQRKNSITAMTRF